MFSKKTKKAAPTTSTASLPDIVFMLLFFFMVSTVMKEANPLVEVEAPKADQITKIKNRSLAHYIYIGAPTDPALGSTPRVQFNDQFATVEQIQDFVNLAKQDLPEAQRSKAITNLKVDKNVEMGLVTDVKTELRKADQLNLVYSTLAQEEK